MISTSIICDRVLRMCIHCAHTRALYKPLKSDAPHFLKHVRVTLLVIINTSAPPRNFYIWTPSHKFPPPRIFTSKLYLITLGLPLNSFLLYWCSLYPLHLCKLRTFKKFFTAPWLKNLVKYSYLLPKYCAKISREKKMGIFFLFHSM